MLAERAHLTLQKGSSVIVDAVYARPTDRQTIEDVALDASVPFVGLWLDAPDSTLMQRVSRRRNDPSDADAEVIQMQRSKEAGAIHWHRLDASMPSEIVLQKATAYLREQAGAAMNSAPGN
jgi:predicted kinase